MNVILSEYETKEKIAQGLEIARDTIGATMGHGGKLVIYPGNSVWTTMTKDGATVAKHIGLGQDPAINAGTMLAISASVKQEKSQGDGTTLTAVLCKTYWDAVTGSDQTIKQTIEEIDQQLTLFESKVKEYTKNIESEDELCRIALVSTNHDEELAKAITTAVWETGLYGHVVAGIQQQPGVTAKRTPGYVFNAGIQDRDFANHNGIACLLENPYYMLTERTISSTKEIEHLVKELINKNPDEVINIVLIAQDIGYSMRTQILSTFKPDSRVRIAYIPISQLLPTKAQFTLEDIAAVTGSKIIPDSTTSLKGYNSDIFGRSENFYSDREKTIIYGTTADIENRIYQLNAIIESADSYLVELANASLGMIQGGLYEINIGALSESELLERRDRANDAILACRSALRGGYIVGGGTVPYALSLSGYFSNEFIQVLQYPIQKIITNAEITIDQHLKSVEENGIIDPSNVIIDAYKNSWSVIRNALRCERMILNIERN